MVSSKTLAVATALSTLSAVSAFNPQSKTNVAVYYGQGYDQPRLREFCQDSALDIINIGFINEFPEQSPSGWPGSNFGNQCNGETYTIGGLTTKLLSGCHQIVEDIPICQAAGKKVFLSLGGASPATQQILEEDTAIAFADFLWLAFGPVNQTWVDIGGPRPFGDVVVDGFDFDIEHNGGFGYADMVNRFREHYAEVPDRTFYISGAPQCPIPDAQLSDAITNSPFDFVWVQFYNNPGCSAMDYVEGNKPGFNYDAWVKVIKHSANPNAKLYVGLPASDTVVNPGYYLTPEEVEPLVEEYMKKYPETFGGIMLWEATASERNQINGGSYADSMKSILNGCAPTPSPTPSPSSTPIPSSTPTPSSTPVSSTTTTTSSSAVTSSSSVVSSSSTTSSTTTSTPSSSAIPSSSVIPSSSAIPSSSVIPSSSPVTTRTPTSTPIIPTTTRTRTSSVPVIPTTTRTPTRSPSSTPTKSPSASVPGSSTPGSSAPVPSSSSSTSCTDTTTGQTTSATTTSSSTSVSSSSTSCTDSTTSGNVKPTTTSSSTAVSSSTTCTDSTTSGNVKPTTTSSSTSGSSSSTSCTDTTTSGHVKPTTTSSSAPGQSGTTTTGSGITSGPVSTPTTTTAPSTTEDSTTYTTVIVTSYTSICPTGFTTVTTTYTTTYCPGNTATATATLPPTGPGAQTSAPAPPEGWTTTVTVCTQCAATPTTVTLTLPAPTTTEAPVAPTTTATLPAGYTTTVTVCTECGPAPTTVTVTVPIVAVPTGAPGQPTGRPVHSTTSRPVILGTGGVRPSSSSSTMYVRPSSTGSRAPVAPTTAPGDVSPVFTGAAPRVVGWGHGAVAVVGSLLYAFVM